MKSKRFGNASINIEETISKKASKQINYSRGRGGGKMVNLLAL